MHQIEPFYLWRDYYQVSEDFRSPFYKKNYSELYFSNRIYNFLIHPQWDGFGSETLYFKQLFVDYEQGFCVLEFIGEWNDAINNDIMFLKNEVVNVLIQEGIKDYILILENVLNFHASDTDYYEEWKEEIEGDIYFINALDHVLQEAKSIRLNHILLMDDELNDVDWRTLKPNLILDYIKNL